MASTTTSSSSKTLVLAFAVVVVLVSSFPMVALSDLSGDRSECANQLVGLAPCLAYVEGNARSPTPDCCDGLKQVLAKSPKCLCVLVKDRDDPQLGLKLNVSLALSLPAACSAPANISACPKLLNLPPNSTDAAIFKQGGSASTAPPAKGNTPSSSGSAQESSGGSSSFLRGSSWVSVVELVVGCTTLLFLVLPFHSFMP
ncbi:protein YLS3-like [Ananas comosus]|uniref:Protein YLS3 n=1 Tax=Ananas comosus TaxID=4615 RepID=A0A199VVB3_ANACO|nr:protein YLS3-like [Ananas comosus]OAY80871.1 Protein YLS3 [Ananas comosus]